MANIYETLVLRVWTEYYLEEKSQTFKYQNIKPTSMK